MQNVPMNRMMSGVRRRELKLATHYAFRPDRTTPDRQEDLTRLIFVPIICERRVGSEQCVHDQGCSGSIGSGRKASVCAQLKGCGRRELRGAEKRKRGCGEEK